MALRRMALAAAVALLLAGTAASWPSMAPVAPTPLGRVLDTADALVGAETWTDRFLALTPYFDPGLKRPEPVAETREIPILVEAVYAHLGAGLDEKQRSALTAHAAALPAEARVALQQVLGAVELGMTDWERAVAGLTPDDWKVLGAHTPLEFFQSLDIAAEAAPVAAKIDGALIHASAARLLATLDEVSPLLQEVTATSVPSERAPLFPGPNEGVLFNDPFNFILVGDVVKSIYRGNTWPFPGSIRSTDHILILDLGGDDEYLDHPATAFPLPQMGVCLSICNKGLPVSVVADLTGSDVYLPLADDASTAFAANGGLAILLDLAGNDRYINRLGSSQGVSLLAGEALLLDALGDDLYVSSGYSQAATHGIAAVSVVMDLQGVDRYDAQGVSQGVNIVNGNAFSIDLQGDDVITAGSYSQGSAYAGGVAMHLNVGGSDYYSSIHSSRGFTRACWDSALPFIPTCPMDVDEFLAVFLDTCGIDTYTGWLGHDDELWQQNMFGLGLDLREAGSCTANE